MCSIATASPGWPTVLQPDKQFSQPTSTFPQPTKRFSLTSKHILHFIFMSRPYGHTEEVHLVHTSCICSLCCIPVLRNTTSQTNNDLFGRQGHLSRGLTHFLWYHFDRTGHTSEQAISDKVRIPTRLVQVFGMYIDC